MALRAFYILHENSNISLHKTLLAPSFGRYWKHLIGRHYLYRLNLNLNSYPKRINSHSWTRKLMWEILNFLAKKCWNCRPEESFYSIPNNINNQFGIKKSEVASKKGLMPIKSLCCHLATLAILEPRGRTFSSIPVIYTRFLHSSFYRTFKGRNFCP